jgi:hypothetical protein
MQHLSPNTQEWATAWALLAEHPLNIALPDSKMAVNDGEVWEYMGTADGRHTFRHRCHPATGKREYLHFLVPCDEVAPQ